MTLFFALRTYPFRSDKVSMFESLYVQDLCFWFFDFIFSQSVLQSLRSFSMKLLLALILCIFLESRLQDLSFQLVWPFPRNLLCEIPSTFIAFCSSLFFCAENAKMEPFCLVLKFSKQSLIIPAILTLFSYSSTSLTKILTLRPPIFFRLTFPLSPFFSLANAVVLWILGSRELFICGSLQVYDYYYSQAVRWVGRLWIGGLRLGLCMEFWEYNYWIGNFVVTQQISHQIQTITHWINKI